MAFRSRAWDTHGMAAPGRVYGGVSAADRLTERRTRFLAAGLELIGTRGVADVTIGQICAEAGLAKRYFYELFDSLDAFVDALMNHTVDVLAERVVTREPERRTAGWQRRRLAVFIDAITEDPRLARLVFVETFGAGGSLAAFRQAMIHRAVEQFVKDFLPPDISEIADARTIRMMAYAMSGACAELLLGWLQGEVEANANEIVDYLAALFVSATHATQQSTMTRAGRDG